LQVATNIFTEKEMIPEEIANLYFFSKQGKGMIYLMTNLIYVVIQQKNENDDEIEEEGETSDD